MRPLNVGITRNSFWYIQKTCTVLHTQTFNNFVLTLWNWVPVWVFWIVSDVNKLSDGKKVLGGYQQKHEKALERFVRRKKKSNYGNTLRWVLTIMQNVGIGNLLTIIASERSQMCLRDLEILTMIFFYQPFKNNPVLSAFLTPSNFLALGGGILLGVCVCMHPHTYTQRRAFHCVVWFIRR